MTTKHHPNKGSYILGTPSNSKHQPHLIIKSLAYTIPSNSKCQNYTNN